MRFPQAEKNASENCHLPFFFIHLERRRKCGNDDMRVGEGKAGNSLIELQESEQDVILSGGR